MVHKTKGIILRTVKFGETSLIVTLFTELFGLQSYIVNSVRMTSKRKHQSGFFQPSAVLDLVVYHNQFKNLQRIREYRWAHLYQHILSDVRKNAVALFMIELFTKCLKEPEENTSLFYFVEDALLHLDEASPAVTANFSLFFGLHLAVFFGFRITDEFSETKTFIDLHEGTFVESQPSHPHYLEDKEAEAVSHILKISQPHDLQEVKLNQEMRRRLLSALEQYYGFHIADFGTMKTLPVLREIAG